jgi:hypothetical protein
MTQSPSKIPAQELFLEYENKEREYFKISLDQIECLSDDDLKGFHQWLIAKISAMESEKSCLITGAADQKQIKGLNFKVKIHRFFLSEVKDESYQRKLARQSWSKKFAAAQNGNEPCHWLNEFDLPAAYSRFKDSHKRATKIAHAYREFLENLRVELGAARVAEILDESGLLAAGDDCFVLAASRIKGSSKFFAEGSGQ